jgi:hypothetical protein
MRKAFVFANSVPTTPGGSMDGPSLLSVRPSLKAYQHSTIHSVATIVSHHFGFAYMHKRAAGSVAM